MPGNVRKVARLTFGAMLVGGVAFACGGKETHSATTCGKGARCGSPADAGVTSSASCAALITAIGMSLNETLHSVQGACQSDEDCVEFPLLSCIGSCPRGVLPKGALAEAEKGVAILDDAFCPTFRRERCDVHEVPCVPHGHPFCVAGSCLTDASDTGSAPADCRQRAMAIGSALSQVAAGLDGSCTRDDDCVAMPVEDPCWFGCPVYVSRQSQRVYADQSAAIDRDLCRSFLADGCHPGGTNCGVSFTAGCNDGVCGSRVKFDGGLSCEKQTDWLHQEILLGSDHADRRCSSDADCRVVSLALPCYDPCEFVAVSAAGADLISNGAMLADSACRDLVAAGCDAKPATCSPPGSATCEGGVCWLP